ncbi:MAG: 6-phosphogluconate dehydrogenase [Microbacteriaceae bacterium BACL28 MAG-120531-bin53]|nr:MAG: 6-phosphogluconate dehydrogenase [Microbacteriaceae bacterium BACL28 MAG-120531-bin53]
MSATANIGVVGLAVMGSNLARNLASRSGNNVAIYNRSVEKTNDLVANHPEANFIASDSIDEFVASLAKPRIAIIMVQAGFATDAVITALSDRFEKDDIIVDGGNALYTDTIRREKEVSAKDIHFVGAGISGGEEGALNGPSIMPGGSKESYEHLGPILRSIAAVAEGEACVTHIGSDGAGHFVKMIHNGIEYADMQLIAEAYDILRQAGGLNPLEISRVLTDWNAGELESYLIEITAEVLAQVDQKTGEPLVDVILDAAGSKGTGVWTVQSALDLGTPVSGIAEAVFARSLSSQADQRAGAPEYSAGDSVWEIADQKAFIEDVRKALYASKIVAYAQGFDAIRAGAIENNWDINLGEVAKIWRGGCIIRAQFLNRISDAYKQDAKLLSLLFDGYFIKAIEDAATAWRQVVSKASLAGIPVPAFASSLSYFDGLRAERLPAALVQGQRDFFGAHTYKRVDMPGTFHTLWSGDKSEIQTD